MRIKECLGSYSIYNSGNIDFTCSIECGFIVFMLILALWEQEIYV